VGAGLRVERYGFPVPDTFSSRTVAIVALASLLAGFVVVFAGGMLLFAPASTAPPAPPLEVDARAAHADAGLATALTTEDRDASDPAPIADPMDLGEAGAPVGMGASVRFAPSAVSRCWDMNNPAILPGASCDRLQAIDDHFASKSAEIAGCARGHGRLAFIMDLRFSTGFVRSWGGPSSTIANAGTVVACVRRVTQPLPLGTAPHAHDRYLMVLPIDW
jgi:hypothetical protein